MMAGRLLLVPGGIPGIYLGFRWTCNVCVGYKLSRKNHKELTNPEKQIINSEIVFLPICTSYYKSYL